MTGQLHLSRTERRRLEREQRKAQRKAAASSKSQCPEQTTQLAMVRGRFTLAELPPKLRAHFEQAARTNPGGNVIEALPLDTRSELLRWLAARNGHQAPVPAPAGRTARIASASVGPSQATRFGVAIPGAPHGDWALGQLALREVAKTVIEALRELGHEAAPCHYERPEGRQLIVINPVTIPMHEMPPPPAGAILFNFEHYTDAGCLPRATLELYRRYVVWDFNPVNTAALRARGLERVRYVPLGSVPSLCKPLPTLPLDIDALFIG